MNGRRFSFTDRCLGELDSALRVTGAKSRAAQPSPGKGAAAGELTDTERDLASRLMRVNHSGEIAAQALYRGQAMVARNPRLREELLQAADEEHDHLAWCQERTEELGGRISLLTPAWYIGSFAIGMVAGLAGDGTSLGFLAETEKQVGEHLDKHLRRLPGTDHPGRAILEKMRTDEISHGERAVAQGALPLPQVVQKAMRLASKIMTGVAYRV